MGIMQKIQEHPKLCVVEDTWWTVEDVGGFRDLKKAHQSTLEQIMPFVKNTENVIQAGGHCGYVVKLLASKFKTVYTFEPDPTMFLALSLNVPDNVFKFQACVGQVAQSVVMQKNFQNPGAGGCFVNGNGNIPMVRIDDFNLNCDLLMLDIEGFEYYAMKGAIETIKRCSPVICIERFWGARANVTDAMMDEFIAELGYKEAVRIVGSQDIVYARG